MAGDNGGFTRGSIPVDADRFVSSLSFEGARPHMEYGTQKPRIKDGITQWEVDCLFRPLDGDTRHTAAIVPVKIWAKTCPSFERGTPIQLVNPCIYYWNRDGRSGLSYFADDIRPVAQ